MLSTFTTTPIYNRAAFRFPPSGTIGEIEIPIHITKLQTQQNAAKVTEVTYGPLLDLTSNFGMGGTAVSYGAMELEKIAIEGFTDTPLQTYSGDQIIEASSVYPSTTLFPSFTLYPGGLGFSHNFPAPGTGLSSIVIDGNFVTYGEILAAYYEARTEPLTDPNAPWPQVLPRWFRDQFGRVYTNPRIIELTIQRVEAVPGRNNFTMTLQVN